MAYEVNRQTSAAGGVFRRVGWKLLIVGLAVGAFFGLNSLEGAKTSYRKDQLAPLVIGDFGSSAPNKGHKPETGRAVGLDYREIQKLLGGVLYPSTPIEEAGVKRKLEEQKYSEPVIASLQESPMRMRAKILHSISRAATVRDENALIGSITEKIDEARAAEEKRTDDERASNLSIYKKVSENYPNNPKGFADQINNKDADLGDKLRQRLSKSADTTVANLLDTAAEAENSRHEQKVTEINGFTHINYGRVYSTSFPQALSDYVQGQRVVSLNQNDLLSRILDDKRGEYAIYQAGYLTCIVLLVFGLLYPIYLLLRLLPPFAASLDPLADQAKAIISGRTSVGSAGASLASSGIAKSLALSVAAVGIGTAVAVANNGPSPTKQTTELVSVSPLERELINARIKDLIEEEAKHNPAASPSPAPGEPEINRVEAQLKAVVEAILSRPPGGGMDRNGLASTRELAALQSLFDRLNLSGDDVARLKSSGAKADELYNRTSGVDFLDLNKRTADIAVGDATRLKDLVPRLGTRTADLETKTVNLETKATDLENKFFKKLDTANNQILGARDDSFVGAQGAQGRNLFTRMKQLFRERYMATNQSYRVMENLMCEQSKWPGVPTPESCSRAEVREILGNLRKLIGQDAMDESAFLKALGASSTPWKTSLLRYNRRPY